MTSIPVLVTPPSGVLSRAYVTPAMFKGFPTWLDLDNLIPEGVANVQDDALADVLLQASDWAVGECENMLLHGHLVSGEQLRAPANSSGRVYVRPRDIPIRSLTALSWGADPSSMSAVALPDASMWFEQGRRMSWVPGGGVTQFRGPALQFGPRLSLPGRVFVNWSYVAGFPFALLATPAAAGDNAVEVDDPAGILPGDTLRIYDPGVSEALTVASTYVPLVPTIPPTPTSIPLASSVQNPHVAGTGITGMPSRMLKAVIAYGVALLMREDVSEEEPVSGFGPAARTTAGGRSGAGGGLVNDAYGWLAPFRPTWRS